MKYLLELIRDLKLEVKNHAGYILLLIGVIVALFLSLLFNSSNLILSLTAIIVLYYTIETHKMRKAIVENTELNTRPILVLEIDFQKKIAFVRNFSNFPAYNFEILDYWFEVLEEGDQSEQKSPIFYKEFERLDVIPPKGRMQILVDKGDFSGFFSSLEPSDMWIHRTLSFKADALYDDVLNNNWKMTIGYSAGKVIATKPQRINRKDYNTPVKGDETYQPIPANSR